MIKEKKGIMSIKFLISIIIFIFVLLLSFVILSRTSKENKVLQTARKYVTAVNKYISKSNYPYTLQNGVYYVSGIDTRKIYLNDVINIKSNKPESGWVLVQDRKVVQYSFKINKYIVSVYFINDKTATKIVAKATDENVNLLSIPEGVTEQTLEY